MIVTTINAAISVAVAGGVAALAYGYSTGLRGDGPTRLFAISYAILAASSVARLVYWDIFFAVLLVTDRPAAQQWADATGGLAPNILFGAGFLLSIYLGLRARLALIPEEDRHRYRWWNSWTHPPRRMRG